MTTEAEHAASRFPLHSSPLQQSSPQAIPAKAVSRKPSAVSGDHSKVRLFPLSSLLFPPYKKAARRECLAAFSRYAFYTNSIMARGAASPFLGSSFMMRV